MTAAANRVSTYTSTSTATDGRGEQKNLWTSMLGSVASGKRLPEKNVLVLGVCPRRPLPPVSGQVRPARAWPPR